MEVEIEDIMKRKDYSLQIIWHRECTKCGSRHLRLFMHRTEEEVKKEINPIKQICGVNMCREVHYPWRQCTKCKSPYPSYDSECVGCEDMMRHRTKLELGIEDDLARLKSIANSTSSTAVADREAIKGRVRMSIHELQEVGYYTKEEDYKNWPEEKVKPQDIRRVQ
jgi:hypothetical protein